MRDCYTDLFTSISKYILGIEFVILRLWYILVVREGAVLVLYTDYGVAQWAG